MSRGGLALGYFIAVNLLAGWLAVDLRDPSLWGNTTGLFGVELRANSCLPTSM